MKYTKKKGRPPARKAFRPLMEKLLALPVTGDIIENFDTDGTARALWGRESLSPAEIIAATLTVKAMKGDLKAFEIVRETVGEKPGTKAEADIKNIPKIVVKRRDDE